MKTSLTSIKEEQCFGDNPLKVRSTNHYQEEYVHNFVEKWDELIDWDARSKVEGDFFIKELKKRGVKKVLDVATGTGYHSVQLLKAGFDVTSADGSPAMLAKAFENGKKHGFILKTCQADWRWLNRDIHDYYDAVICLGNSFTHLFNEKDRRKALAEFYAILEYDGILILDQRNYDIILDDEYNSKHAYYYCGDQVKVEPDSVDDGLARFKYEFSDKSTYYLNMYPLRLKYTTNMMREVGFQKISTYSDFQETYHVKEEDNPDFYIHIAEKKYVQCDKEGSK